MVEKKGREIWKEVRRREEGGVMGKREEETEDVEVGRREGGREGGWCFAKFICKNVTNNAKIFVYLAEGQNAQKVDIGT